ncbi:hypothetical protein HYDPIDRAFT_36226 [Hydnomerulius pinastri MD-312]|nr:hypothetical protein HYDPIDRAFT_36226 [Hydnomerulius pinastri MD-312]
MPSQSVGGFPSEIPIKLSAASMFLGVVCDWLISGSVYFYLRSSRSGVKRTETRIQRIMTVFVNMGLCTCMLSCILFILCWVKNGSAYVGAPSMILCETYVNSILAV